MLFKWLTSQALYVSHTSFTNIDTIYMFQAGLYRLLIGQNGNAVFLICNIAVIMLQYL